MPPLNEKIVVTPIIRTIIETDVAKIETDVGVNFFEISKDLYLSQFQSKKNRCHLYFFGEALSYSRKNCDDTFFSRAKTGLSVGLC